VVGFYAVNYDENWFGAEFEFCLAVTALVISGWESDGAVNHVWGCEALT
jgi:hypothetical protein